MIEVTSRHTECTYFNSDYSQMPAVALQYEKKELPKTTRLRESVVVQDRIRSKNVLKKYRQLGPIKA